jgi:hypothetical protein
MGIHYTLSFPEYSTIRIALRSRKPGVAWMAILLLHPMNVPMRKDDPARLELIAKSQPERLLPHQWQKLQEFRSRMTTVAFPQEIGHAEADRQAA